VSYHVEVSSDFLKVELPSMPAKRARPFTGMFFGPESLVFQFFIAIWTYWCRISGIFNITLIDFDRFTAASIINNS